MPASTKSKIYFFFEKPVTLKDRQRLKQYIESLFRKERRALASLNYIFCTDERVLEINRQYLKHDFYTDIITFELSGPGESMNGEVYISLDRVRDNAMALKQTFSRELHRVIFHGALHLCGYGDKTTAESTSMRTKEEHYLDKYFH